MDWVKLSARYYLDPVVASLDDPTEVMFTRALAYAGDQETHGFVPAGMLPALCRRRRYEAYADALVAAGLWLPVRGGYRIARWQEWQEELEAIVRRRSADRDRKRRERAARAEQNGHAPQEEEPQVNGMSRDMSADSPALIERRETDKHPPHPTGAPPPQKRATRLPGDFKVTPEMVTWAREHVPYVDGRYETEKFTDHWTAATGRNATKRDWPAAWRNWMRRASEQQTPRGRHSRSTTDDRIAGAQALKAQLANRPEITE